MATSLVALVIAVQAASSAARAPELPTVSIVAPDRFRVALFERPPADARVGRAPRRQPGVQMCVAPCHQRVDPRGGKTYYIGGRGITPSAPFSIGERPGTVTVVVDPGRRGLTIAGWIAAVVGTAGVVAGATTMVLADDDRGQLAGGGITLGVGVPLLIAGTIMIVRGRTRLAIRPAGG